MHGAGMGLIGKVSSRVAGKMISIFLLVMRLKNDEVSGWMGIG